MILKAKLFISIILASYISFGQTLVEDISKLPSMVKNATAGEEFIIVEGIYDEDLTLEAFGSIEDSMVVRAQNVGKVIFNSKVVLTGEYLVFKGFRFEDLENTPDSVKLSTTIKLEKLQHCSLVANQFIETGRNAKDTHDVIISVNNSNNIKIESNYFFNSKASCIYVAPPSQTILIKGNIFNGTPRAGGNRWEMLKVNYRIKESRHETKVVVSGNIFLNYSGDRSEVISLKASRNYVLDNLFYRCNGDVTFRQGTDNMVSGNVFYHSSGVRVSGKNHTISSNYFVDSTRSPITIMSGDGAKKNPVYEPVSNVSIVNNFVREFKYPAMIIGLGLEKYNVPPTDLIISNNQFIVQDKGDFVDWRESDKFDFDFMNNISSDSTNFDINKILKEKNILLPDIISVDIR